MGCLVVQLSGFPSGFPSSWAGRGIDPSVKQIPGSRIINYAACISKTAQGLIGHHSMEAPTPGKNWKFNGFVRSAHKIRQSWKGELAAKKTAFDHELPNDPPTGVGAGPLRMTTPPAED